MENNTNIEINETENKEEITYTQEELDKKIQSETDKVRTDYSKKIKDLQAKIKELTPVEKSEKEIELEKRLADVEAREKAIKLRDSLDEKGIDSNLSAFLKTDVDIDALGDALNNFIANKIKMNAYKPIGHKAGESLSKDDFKRMTYAQKDELYRQNPELYRDLAGH